MFTLFSHHDPVLWTAHIMHLTIFWEAHSMATERAAIPVLKALLASMAPA